MRFHWRGREHSIFCMHVLAQQSVWNRACTELKGCLVMGLHRSRCFLKLLHHLCIFLSPFLILVSTPCAQAAADWALAAPMAVLLWPQDTAFSQHFLHLIFLLDVSVQPTAKQREVKDKFVTGWERESQTTVRKPVKVYLTPVSSRQLRTSSQWKKKEKWT